MNYRHSRHNRLFTKIIKGFPYHKIRTVICFAVITNFCATPGSAIILRQVYLIAEETIIRVAGSFDRASFPLKQEPNLVSATQQETLAERIARVSSIRITPHKLVAYIGESHSFAAIGLDSSGQIVHGVRFDWDSSKEIKLQIDETGRATFLQAGQARIICRAGSVEATVAVLIRPTRRPKQTDEEWKQDQKSLTDSTTGYIDYEQLLASMLNSALSRFYPQGGGGASDFGHAAPVMAVGTPPHLLQEQTRLGPVMPGGNFNIGIPVVSLGGRGLAANLTAYYNSNVWGARFDPSNGTVYVFDPIQSWPSPGFTLGFGRIVLYNPFYELATDTHYFDLMLIDPNGTRHEMGRAAVGQVNTCQTTDGTHITFVGNPTGGGTLYYQDGTKVTYGYVNNRLLPTQITEPNGNYIQVSYKPMQMGFAPMAINTITDTLGRVIQFNYGEWPAPDSTSLSSISPPSSAGASFAYTSVTLDTTPAFGDPPVTENAPASFQAISSVLAPARPQYQFSYARFGMINNISFQGGGSISYNYPTEEGFFWEGLTFTQRTESPGGVFTYSSQGYIQRPDNTKLYLTGNTVMEIKNSANATVAKTLYTYANDPSGQPQVQSIILYDETNKTTKVDFSYDQYGNVINKREYGYQIGGQWKVRRRTAFTYVPYQQYIDAYMRSLVMKVEVYDALLNTNDADDALIKKIEFQYDNYTIMGGMEMYSGSPAPPGYLTSYDSQTTRGNITGVTKWTDLATNASTTHNRRLDKFGNVVRAQVSCCSEKSMGYTQNTYWSKAETMTSGVVGGLSLTSTATYNFSTGTMANSTDTSGQTTGYSYDSASRLSGASQPTGASSTISYGAWGPTSSTTTYNDGGVQKTLVSSVVYDGFGQVSRTVDVSGVQVNYGYDPMGRLVSKTNPFAQGATPGPATTYQYDPLGRITVEAVPGGNTIQTSYSSSTVTTTDQVNRKIKQEYDGLGRLIKVAEQGAAGALNQETNYTYDAADNLVEVNQAGQLRKFKYDSSGRLTYERIPEQAATIWDGVAENWSTRYTYNDWGGVATRMDARGAVTNYSYDELRRLVQKSYNVPAGVAATPTVIYTYDNNQSSSTKGLLLSVSVGASYSESYSYDSNERVSGLTRVMDGRSYTTSYQFNQANQPTQVTYPSNSRVMSISYDSKGRLLTVADQYRTYVGNINYNGSGQISSYSRGNGLVESFTYDSNRMQMTQQMATLGTNTLMNLTYSYQASAGQMGGGSTAGNANQLMSISGTIGGVTESAAYTYDLQERLITSNQTTNGVTAQRRFAYDRWGNRTGLWNAVSGGNQIQSVTLQQSGGAPTNRIASVNNSGQNFSYTYDAAGNVSNDGVHSYSYDAENRLVSVDGATVSYNYDHRNRRYKKVAGATSTHYIWEESQVIAEYDASSGALLMNYVSAGGRLIASMGSGILKWYLSDRLSTRLILDNNGNIIGRQGHLPYGEEIAGIGDQEKKHFTSYERDTESGLDYAVNRYYVSHVGRFTSVDPYNGSNDISNPQSLNRYTYVENEPINRTDPLGLYPWSIIGLGGGVNAYRICFSAGENSWCEWRVISEYEPRPGEKNSTPCSGRTKAPLTGKLLEKYNAGRDIIRDKLQNSEQCRNYLTEHNINPDDALNAVDLQRAYDGSKSDISRIDAGLAPPPGEIPGATQYNRVLNACVSATFKHQGSKLGAMTAIWPDQQNASETTVEERSDVYFGQNFSAATILHEALHSLFGVQDPALAELLEVDISKEGSIAITKALKENGCGD